MCAVLVVTLSVTLTGGVSFAQENAPTHESTLGVGHISDVHYFPLSQCYTDVKNDDYEKSDFFYSMTGDTKLVLESGMVQNSLIHSIIANGLEGTAPHYLVASGDLSKNGERVALIDVANSLRYLQNTMRAIPGYEDFQVFATTGNHDLYNPDGAVYDQEDGTTQFTDVVTAMQFALIFAGLGYPDANLTGADGAINLTEYMPESYWYSSFTSGYQASKNSTHIEINYYSETLQTIKNTANAADRLALYYTLDDSEINVLSFTAELLDEANKGYSFVIIDSSDRVEGSTIVALGKAEYELMPETSKTPIYLMNNDGTLKKLKKSVEEDRALLDDDAFAAQRVYRSTSFKHLTGGRVTEACLDWAEQFCATQTDNKTTLGEETIIASFHQNVLPHFDQEDDILKDFTLYNWENTAKRLLAMGCRYVLTGHMHASDVMTYTDAEGRTLYDFETGSCVSYSSPWRNITFERENCDGKLGEKVTSVLHTVDNLKELASNNIYTAAPWNQAAYDAAIAVYNANPTDANWNAVLASNENYELYIIEYEWLSNLSYNTFASVDIYSRLIDRVLDHFVSERLIDTLKNTVKNLLVGENAKLPDTFAGIGAPLAKLAEYLIDVLVYDLYGDAGYVYNKVRYDNALDYLRAIVEGFLDIEFGDASLASPTNPANAGKVKLKDIASFISVAHAQGTEITLCGSKAELEAEYAYIDKIFDDEEDSFANISSATQAQKNAAFMQPTNATYRKRMTAAIKELHEYAESGQLVERLLDTLLQPLYYDDNSLLKTLLNYRFDFSKGKTTPMHGDNTKMYFTDEEYEAIEDVFTNTLSSPITLKLIEKLVGAKLGKKKLETMDPTNFVLNTTIDEVMPMLKSALANLIGFNLTGDTLVESIDDALNGYLTESFYVGLGGIVDKIIVAFATDAYPDLVFPDGNNANEKFDISTPYVLQPYAGFAYGGQKVTYASSKVTPSSVGASFNPATQDNGRVPSHVTTSFDVDMPTSTYVVKFYTAEDVYANFKLQTPDGTWHTVGTTIDGRTDTDFVDSTAQLVFDGITIDVLTQTKPQYVPLIDLGLAALTHGRVDYDTKDANNITVTVPYIYGERDKAEANSIIYCNVTTVKIGGLAADTTYNYDIEGVYKTSKGENVLFSLKKFSSAPQGFTIRTAKGSDATSFEFLTIADIQGMIQGMYTNSYKAVEALLADERTKNFDFIINAGDMVDSGKNFNQWGYALNTYQPLFANYPQVFTAGNHEGNTYGMTNFFEYSIPKDENNDPLIEDVLGGVYYSFDYANAHFVVLNTNDTTADGLGETQLEWLTNDLTNSTKKWKFVLMHKSIFSGGSHSYDAEVVSMREQLVPLFAETGVSIVFAGHDHTYTSTMLVDKDGNTTDKSDLKGLQYTGDGVLYITLGTMGTKFYEYGENENVTPKLDKKKSILHTLDTQTFGKVVVSDDKIEYVSYYYDSASNSIKEVGESKLVDHTVFDRKIAIALIVVIPTVAVAGAVTATLLILKKKGKLGRKTA